MDIRDIRRATEKLTGPDQPYEMVPETIDGVTFDVFRNAPANLRELFHSSLAHAERDFYVFRDHRSTFAQTWERAAEVANALLREGVQPGDRIAIAARNYPEWIFAFMGITSIGAVAVCMNAWWTSEELAYGLSDSGARLIFADGERLERLRPLAVLSDQALEIEGYGKIPPITDFIPTKLPILSTTFGIFLPKQGTPPEVIETLNRIWATKIPGNPKLKAYTLEKGALFTPAYAQAARDKVWPEIQADAWSFQAAGRAKVTPESLGIPKP